MNSYKLNRLLEIYYLITPVFFLLDYFFQQNIRLTGIESPLLRYFWYSTCLGFGVLFHFRPQWSIFLSFLESVTNLVLLILLFAIPVMAPDFDAIIEGESKITNSSVINFLISGSICVFVFERAKRDIKHRLFS